MSDRVWRPSHGHSKNNKEVMFVIEINTNILKQSEQVYKQ